MKSHVRTAVVLIGAARLALGCTSPTMPPTEPTLAAPEAPRIPWLAAGTPDVEPPRIPWLTDESACPEGWGWVEIAPGVNGCDPYPRGYVEDCGPTGAHFPGEAGCRDLDSGDTEWPRDLPATNVLYVREGASGGDGTIDAPFATLPEALAAAVEGTTIALAPGRYDAGQGAELAAFPGILDTLSHVRAPGVRIRGTSVARTTIVSARPRVPEGSPGDIAMIVVDAADVEISDLRFESPHPAVDVNAGSATVHHVVLDETLLGLYAATGASATFEDVVIRGWSWPGAGASAAIVAEGSVTVRRALLREGQDCVSSVSPSASASVEDLTCSASAGGALNVFAGHLDATRVSIRQPRGPTSLHTTGAMSRLSARWVRVAPVPAGVPVAGVEAGAVMELEDVAADGGASERGMFYCAPDAHMTLSRAAVTGGAPCIVEGEATVTDLVASATGFGPVVRGSGATATLSRIQMSGSRNGLWVHLGATVVASDVALSDHADVALGTLDEGTTLQLERASIRRTSQAMVVSGGALTASDVSIQDLTSASADADAAGVFAVEGANVTLRRMLIERSGAYGTVAASGAALDAEDLSVRGVTGAPGSAAATIFAGDAAPSRLVRADLSARGSGAVVLGPASLEDVSIHDVTPATDGLEGIGLVVGTALGASPPTVTGARIAIADVASLGLLVRGTPLGETGGLLSLSLTDLRIERVGTSTTGGAGVWAKGAAAASLTRFVVRDAATVGLSSEMGATLTLGDGLVTTSTTCTSSESPLDLTTVLTDACGAAPVAWAPPLR